MEFAQVKLDKPTEVEWDPEKDYTDDVRIVENIKEKYKRLEKLMNDMNDLFENRKDVSPEIVSVWNKKFYDMSLAASNLRDLLADPPILPQ